jgi:hypothetical protein
MGAILFFPGQQSHFMKGAFLNTSASRIATSFFRKTERSLDERFYLPEAVQGLLSPLVGHQRAWHKYKYIYFPNNVKKKMLIAKKYFFVPRAIERKGRTGED